VIIHQQIGRSKEATRTAEQLMAARPTFTIAAWLKTRFIRRDTAQVEGRYRPFCQLLGVACWPLTSFTALQTCGRYRIRSGHQLVGKTGGIGRD
jgi:hypothetical protein